MAQDFRGLHCLSADWVYNGGDITIPVPDGYMVTDVILNIQTIVNGGGNVCVGITADTDAFITVQTAVGFYRANEGAAAKADGYKLTTEDIIIDVTPAAATTGAGEVYVICMPVVA